VGKLITAAVVLVLAIGWFSYSYMVTPTRNQSSGTIVNVSEAGKTVLTWDLYLLHGSTDVGEKQSERFSIEPGKGLVELARRAEETGERVTVTYSTLRWWSCWGWRYNVCDVVTQIRTARSMMEAK